MSDVLRELTEEGVSVWLDDINRDRLRTGNLEMLMRDFWVRGVTSNPTIFAHALSQGDAYDEQTADLKIRGVSVEEASRMITTYDIRWAADVLRPAYDETDGLDGRVSIEVDPRLAKETAATVAEAKQLWWLVDRPNMFIKIPATAEGVPAITETLAKGISVNVTLIFSLERYGEVIDAYMAGLEQAAANGHDISQIASVASFFVSRVDTEVDKRLEKIGTPEAAALTQIASAQQTGDGLNDTQRHGRQLLAQSCGICHLPPEMGARTYGPPLNKLAGGGDDDIMREYITNGTPRMPSFKAYLKSTDIDAIISYVRTIPAPAAPAAR